MPYKRHRVTSRSRAKDKAPGLPPADSSNETIERWRVRTYGPALDAMPDWLKYGRLSIAQYYARRKEGASVIELAIPTL